MNLKCEGCRWYEVSTVKGKFCKFLLGVILKTSYVAVLEECRDCLYNVVHDMSNTYETMANFKKKVYVILRLKIENVPTCR